MTDWISSTNKYKSNHIYQPALLGSNNKNINIINKQDDKYYINNSYSLVTESESENALTTNNNINHDSSLTETDTDSNANHYHHYHHYHLQPTATKTKMNTSYYDNVSQLLMQQTNNNNNNRNRFNGIYY